MFINLEYFQHFRNLSINIANHEMMLYCYLKSVKKQNKIYDSDDIRKQIEEISVKLRSRY